MKENKKIWKPITVMAMIPFVIGLSKYYRTYQLWIYCLYNLVIILISVITVAWINRETEYKKKPNDIVLIFITILFICVVQLFIKEDDVIINNKVPSMLNYNYEILKDAINKETTIVTTKNIEVSFKTGPKIKKSRGITEYYLKFTCENDQNNVYQSEINEYSYSAISDLKKLEDTITLEYYNNTGIIKSIDGIDKNDYKKLNKRIKELRELREQLLKIKEEQQKIEREQEREQRRKEIIKKQTINKKKNEILNKSIGKKIENVLEDLNEIDNTVYNIKYLSTKLYKEETIAFVELYSEKGITLYVVKDNKHEDMVEMPKLRAGMSAKEAIQMLQESGFKYNIAGNESYDTKLNGTLKYYQYSPRNVTT